MNSKIYHFLAFDIGASSGRAIVGTLNQKKLSVEEIYRFPNYGIKLHNSYYWNLLEIYFQIIKAIKKYVKLYGNHVDGIGIDTWGVDYVLLDRNNELVGLSYHYRDNRTKGMLEYIFKRVSKEEIFANTGIQFMEINTSTQLFSLVYNNSPKLKISRTFLMIPDYLNFLLTGKKCSEYTIASTTQLINPKTMDWSKIIINKLGIDRNLFQNLCKPGTIIGKIYKDIAREVKLKNKTKIIAPACHDSASAIAAVPVSMLKYKRGEWAYLSSGTWSLLGVEIDHPIINKKSLEYNFTNEGGFENSIRFLKNITGLWIIQECKKLWQSSSSNLNWEKIMLKASKAKPFQCFINPDNGIFHNPSNMIKAIHEYCEKTNQYIPITIGEIARVIFESLALRYKQIIEDLEEITEKNIKALYIIGGGASNNLLNQFTANSLNIPVLTGPIEATAIGNILIQANAIGIVKDLNEIREIVRNSFSIKKFYPKEQKKWNYHYEKYQKIIKKEI